MKVTVTTDLTVEPVTLMEAKKWMRIEDFNTDDLMIEELIKSTRKHLEKFTGLSFGIKTIETITYVHQIEFELPYSPINSVTTVERWDGDGWETQEEETDYFVIGDYVKVPVCGLYRFTYEAGYEECPEDLKTDIKVLTAWQYQNRNINFQADNQVGISEYPHNNLLNSRLYKKVVI